MLNPLMHPYSIWHTDGRFGGRFSNFAAAARRVEFYGKVTSRVIGDREWLVKSDKSGEVWGYEESRRYVQDAPFLKGEAA